MVQFSISHNNQKIKKKLKLDKSFHPQSEYTYWKQNYDSENFSHKKNQIPQMTTFRPETSSSLNVNQNSSGWRNTATSREISLQKMEAVSWESLIRIEGHCQKKKKR